MGKSSINGPFSMAMLSNQKVDQEANGAGLCFRHALEPELGEHSQTFMPKHLAELFRDCDKPQEYRRKCLTDVLQDLSFDRIDHYLYTDLCNAMQ